MYAINIDTLIIHCLKDENIDFQSKTLKFDAEFLTFKYDF